MHAPQIIMIAILAISIGTNLSRHGEPQTGNHNIVHTIIGAAISVAILWWGGFWSH